jgi:mono/diheme cytochrome c family protein
MADVTADGRDDSMSFPDLRAVRFQHTLNRAATLRNGLLPLAARAETQIIVSLGGVARPPRTYALALAVYLLDLGEALPEPENTGLGRDVFDATCATCHAGAGFAGEPVPVAQVGADQYLAESPERRTGFWQVPSLRGVGDRERLFAGGEVEGLDARQVVENFIAELNFIPPVREPPEIGPAPDEEDETAAAAASPAP